MNNLNLEVPDTLHNKIVSLLFKLSYSSRVQSINKILPRMSWKEAKRLNLADSSHVEIVLACTVRTRKRVLEWLQASGEERGQNLQESDRGSQETPLEEHPPLGSNWSSISTFCWFYHRPVLQGLSSWVHLGRLSTPELVCWVRPLGLSTLSYQQVQDRHPHRLVLASSCCS